MAIALMLGACRASPTGAVEAQIVTTEGTIHCTLDAAATPRTVGMFTDLTRRHFYDGLRVFRATDNLMFQSGCPKNDGTGTPGYRIEVEPHGDDEARLSKPGVLLLAAYHAPPNREDPNPPPPGKVIGSQYVVAMGDMHHLAGQVTVIGQCRDLPVVAAITHVVSGKERPVTVTRISIGRD